MAEPQTRAWVVSGRVQGVGFRWFVFRRAESLGLAGRVRNLPDGRVEVIATGPDPDLARLYDALQEGPMLAHVDAVDAIDVMPDITITNSFEII